MKKQLRVMTASLLAAGLCCASVLCTACAQKPSQSEDSEGGNVQSIYVPEVPENKVSADEPGSDYTAAVGETFLYDGKLEVTVDRVMELDDVDKLQYRALLAEMTITNKSDSKVDCSALTHFSIIIDGTEKTEPLRDVQAAVAGRKYYTKIGSELKSLNQAIESGETITGYVSIFAPSAWSEMTLVYMPYKYYNNDRIEFTIDEGELVHYSESLS